MLSARCRRPRPGRSEPGGAQRRDWGSTVASCSKSRVVAIESFRLPGEQVLDPLATTATRLRKQSLPICGDPPGLTRCIRRNGPHYAVFLLPTILACDKVELGALYGRTGVTLLPAECECHSMGLHGLPVHVYDPKITMKRRELHQEGGETQQNVVYMGQRKA